MARFPLRTVVDFRDCGECQACCQSLGIQELAKPMWTRCPHQGQACCEIYENRPPTCAGYDCLWRAGLLEGDERRRPDRLGVIFDFRGETHAIRSMADVGWIEATEVWPGASAEPAAHYLIERIREHFPVRISASQGAPTWQP